MQLNSTWRLLLCHFSSCLTCDVASQMFGNLKLWDANTTVHRVADRRNQNCSLAISFQNTDAPTLKEQKPSHVTDTVINFYPFMCLVSTVTHLETCVFIKSNCHFMN